MNNDGDLGNNDFLEIFSFGNKENVQNVEMVSNKQGNCLEGTVWYQARNGVEVCVLLCLTHNVLFCLTRMYRKLLPKLNSPTEWQMERR
jgi:hypothetical protein